jgi:hypothetical protein
VPSARERQHGAVVHTEEFLRCYPFFGAYSCSLGAGECRGRPVAVVPCVAVARVADDKIEDLYAADVRGELLGRVATLHGIGRSERLPVAQDAEGHRSLCADLVVDADGGGEAGAVAAEVEFDVADCVGDLTATERRSRSLLRQVN